VGVMREIPVLLGFSEAGAALAGGGGSDSLAGMALLSLPKHQPQIDFGRQGRGSRHLPIPGIADWYLAAHDTERRGFFSYEHVENLLG